MGFQRFRDAKHDEPIVMDDFHHVGLNKPLELLPGQRRVFKLSVRRLEGEQHGEVVWSHAVEVKR
jgi:hypothetical protein